MNAHKEMEANKNSGKVSFRAELLSSSELLLDPDALYYRSCLKSIDRPSV